MMVFTEQELQTLYQRFERAQAVLGAPATEEAFAQLVTNLSDFLAISAFVVLALEKGEEWIGFGVQNGEILVVDLGSGTMEKEGPDAP